MMNTGWFSRSSNQQPSSARVQRIAAGIGVAILLLAVGVAVAQNPAEPAPGAAMSVPLGYSVHSSVDVGGRVANTVGSGAMYDTLVNLQSGPRVLGQTFEMRALPGNKHPLFDNLSAFSSGYGGEPYDFSKLAFSKGKIYEFSSLFRRDRQYADYNLIGNPNIPNAAGAYSIPISGSTTPYLWPEVVDSPFLFNTVRRMTDTNLTLLPLSKVTFRFAYSQNIFQGPSRTPSGNSVAGQEVILEEYQRHSTDDFTGGIDWKPIQGTKLTFEEQIDHYRGDSYFTMDPTYLNVQEQDGTKVALLASYQSPVPYGYSSATGAFAPSGNCNSGSMINYSAGPPASGTILYANPNGGLPIIDPACAVISSYFRQQPTREIFPTEIFRLQSSSIKNISMNGDVRYTSANMNLPNYYEAFNGLTVESSSTKSGVTTITPPESENSYGGYASAKREVIAVDYGIVWQASKTVALEDQVSFSNTHQPGSANFTGATALVNASTTGLTINNSALTSCVWSPSGVQTCTPALPTVTPPTTVYKVSSPTPSEGSPGIGVPAPGYFGQRFVTNNFTVSWDATPRSTFSLTYRHGNHVITEGYNISIPAVACPASTTVNPPPGIPLGLQQAFCGTVTINEDGGIFNAALRPASNWELNGTVELLYDDNVFTPVSPRQTQHYRIHTLYRPKPWATISGAYNDLERHNNTNNMGAVTTADDGVTPMALNHADHSRVVSLGAALYPNTHYGFDLSYAYSDVYTSTNTCFQGVATVLPALSAGGPTTVLPGAAFETPGTTSATLCASVPSQSGRSTTLFFGPARDFADAPTQYASAALALSPVTKLHTDFGYRISSVNGSRFFNQAQDVLGTLLSTYQSPFVKLAYTMHPGLIWKAEYNYFGYGEGGQSGAAYCNNDPTIASTYAGDTVQVVPCNTVPNTSMYPGTPAYGFTAPRNFHANNVMLGVHYEF